MDVAVPDDFQETFNKTVTPEITLILFTRWTLPNFSRLVTTD